MTPLKPFFKEYRAAGAFERLVNIDAAVDEHILATKGGDLVIFVSLRGVDPDCLDAEQISSVVRAFEASLRQFDDRFRIHQYLLKSEHPGLACGHHANPVIEEALQNRVLYLNTRPQPLYRTLTYAAIAYEGWLSKENSGVLAGRFGVSRRAFSFERAQRNGEDSLDQARDLLRNKVIQWVLQCSEPLDVRVLKADDAFQVLRRLLNYAPAKAEAVRLKFPQFVASQAVSSELECHRDYLRLDDHYVTVLTLKEPPAQTSAGMLRGLASLQSSFILASEWRREDTAKVRSLIHSKRRHFHNSKTSLATHMTSTNPGVPRDVLIDTGAAAHIGDLGGCLEEIDVNGRSFGEYSLTLVLYGTDWPALRAATAQALKLFAVFDAHLVEERYNRFNAWLAIQPGNQAFNLRRQWLTDANHADLSFLFAPNAGESRNLHLGAECLATLETESGVPYFLNLHDQDVAHTFVLGATGSGKSFFLNFIVTHLQKYDPFTVLFDLGGSYEDLTELLGGRCLSIRPEKRRFTINPFSLPPTFENGLFLLSWTRVLIESGGYQMSGAEEQDLYDQIVSLAELAPPERRLATLARIVQRNLRARLERWVEGGPYGDLFDHAEDTLTFAKFQTFDFDGMDDHQEQLEPLLFYILHRASVQVDAEPARFKAFVLDEAWRFFQHPVIKPYLVEALKTWRKKNAAVILATQSFDDLRRSDILPIVVESCPTQIFLANPRMDKEAYRRAFHLNDAETERIAALVPKRELLIKRPGNSKVASLTVSPREYWIYTTHPRERDRKRRAFARFGLRAGLNHLVENEESKEPA